MRTSDLDYELPESRIAQHPPERRSDSRLLVVGRDDDRLEDTRFADLPDLLASGDLLVHNDSRVLPARLGARRASGGRIELLLVRRLAQDCWLSLARPSARLHDGEQIRLERGGDLTITRSEAALAEGLLEVRGDGLESAMESAGSMPLPPYIRRDASDGDRERYQTVYARHPGSVAAPTAGLHFDPPLLEALARRGVDRTFVTLHVGPGTFRPIRTPDLETHTMHSEMITVSQHATDRVTATRAGGGRIVAVGTTSVRALESASSSGALAPRSGPTDIFIQPGYRFRSVDALVTNFHAPRSTLLALVAAFTGLERTRRAYRAALERGYRFLSYGDAMLIL